MQASALPQSQPQIVTVDPHAFHSPPLEPSAEALQAVEIQRLRVELARRDEIIAHRQRQIEVMKQTSDTLFTAHAPDRMVREALHIAVGAVGGDAGNLIVHDPDHDSLVFRYSIGPGADRLTGYSTPVDCGIAGQVFRSGLSTIVGEAQADAAFDPEIDRLTGHRTRSLITVPLRRPEGKMLGVLQIVNHDESFDAFDLEVLEVIAAQAASAIDNAQLAQQARKAELVNLIGDISHDIKNMLTPIQTGVWTLEPMVQEMLRDLDKLFAAYPEAQWVEQVRQATDLIRTESEWILHNALSAAERVQVRTKEIADVIKGETAPPRFVEGNFNEVAQEVYSHLRLPAYDQRVDMDLDLDPVLPPVEFDRKQIYNALYNLVNNAIPETPAGGVITIRTRMLSSRESNFLVEVSDTGKGMPEEVRQKLFTDEAVSTKPGGTGLGTRIVASVVRVHRGHISVQSEPDKGTRFTILMPLRQNSC